MGFLSGKKTPPSEPVRPNQVRRLKAAMKAADDAFAFDAPDHSNLAREERQAEAMKDAVWRNSTAAERAAARKAH